MDDKTNAQTRDKRQIVESLDREFARLHVNSCVVIAHTATDILYAVPTPAEIGAPTLGMQPVPSIGESVLRSAAAIEQTFGGITSNLWDDPFEWTLPEYLSTPEKLTDHLGEVEATRKRAFTSFPDDACLLKNIAVPAGDLRSLIDLILETLVRAAAYQAQALVVQKILSGISPSGFII
jgi:hypothetical protein